MKTKRTTERAWTMGGFFDSMSGLLILVFVNSLPIGGILSYGRWRHLVEDVYGLSQYQAELVGTLYSVTCMGCLAAGILLDRVSVRGAGYVTMATGVIAVCNLVTVYYPGDFNSSLYPLLGLFYVIMAVGSSVPYILSVGLYVQRFPLYGGRVLKAAVLGMSLSVLLLTSEYLSYRGILLFLGTTQLTAALSCAFLLNPQTKDGAIYRKYQPETVSAPAQNGAHKSTAQNISTNGRRANGIQKNNKQLSNGYPQPAVVNRSKSKKPYGVFYGEGFDIMKTLDFCLVLLTTIYPYPSQKGTQKNVIATFIGNYKSIITETPLCVFLPLMISLTLLFDIYKNNENKYSYSLILFLVKLPFVLTFIFYGNHVMLIHFLILDYMRH